MSKKKRRKKENISNNIIELNKNTVEIDIETEEKIELIKKRVELVGIISTIVVIVYQIINYIHNLNYQISCEKFYNIPKKYFEDSINKQLLYISLISLLLIFGIVPILLRKYEKKKGLETKGVLVYWVFLTAFVGAMIGFVNVLNLQTIVNRGINLPIYVWIDTHANFSGIIVILFWIITLISMLFIDEIKNAKCKIIKGTIIVILFISGTVSLLLMLFGTKYKLEIQVQNKTKYEFAEKDKEMYIVVTEYKDKKIAMKYKVEDNRCILDTGKYCFIGDEAVYSYKELKYAPIGNSQ